MAARAPSRPTTKPPANPPANPAPRPTKFDDAQAGEICRRLADGETLRDICLEPEMPARATVRRWQAENSQFRAQYAAAREHLADALAEDAVHQARYATSSTASSRRLYVDAIKWYAAKLAPKRYGEKVAPDAAAKVTIGDAIEKGRERVKRLREG